MTVELRPEMTASSQDLYLGLSANFVRNAHRAQVLVRVADNIEEVCQEIKNKGMSLQDTWGSELIWGAHKPDQESEEPQFSFFVDQVDGFVWVADRETEKFQELFGAEKPSVE